MDQMQWAVAQAQVKDAQAALGKASGSLLALARYAESLPERQAAAAAADALAQAVFAARVAATQVLGNRLGLEDLERSEGGSGGSDSGGAVPWVLVPATDKSRHGRQS